MLIRRGPFPPAGDGLASRQHTGVWPGPPPPHRADCTTSNTLASNLTYDQFIHELFRFQDEHYEDEDGEDEDGILGSSFAGRNAVEVYDLPENEALFLPTNMDAAQLSFKFKEVEWEEDHHKRSLDSGHL